MYDLEEGEELEKEDESGEDEEERLGFAQLEADIIESNNDINKLTFANQIINSNNNNLDEANDENDPIDVNAFEQDQEFYDPTFGKSVTNLIINLGTDELPRFQCADHKLDIVVKKAIKMHSELSSSLQKLNKSNAHFKRVCKLSKIFRKKKCRLRLQGKQRWSLVYLILEATKKAYDKNAFDQNDQERRCPIPYDKIELYLQILKPLYLLNISLQSNHSTIADVIPGIKAYK